MKNIAHKPIDTKEIEYLSLDDYVSAKNKESVLYVRIKGNSMGGFISGDLAVVNREIKPKQADKVLCEIEGTHTILDAINLPVQNSSSYLVASNGKRVEAKVVRRNFEVIGVVTHVVKTINSEVVL